MGILGLFRQSDINRGVEAFRSTSGSVLLDVRTLDKKAFKTITDQFKELNVLD